MYGSRSVPRIPPSPSAAWRFSASGGAPQAGQTLVQSGRGLPQSGQSDSVTDPPCCRSSRAFAVPARAVSAGVDVGEGPVAAAGLVDPDPAHQGRILPLDLLRRVGEDLRVLGVHLPVAVEVVGLAVTVVVDVDVGRVAVHVAAQVGAAARVAAALVVAGGAEAAHHGHVVDVVALL